MQGLVSEHLLPPFAVIVNLGLTFVVIAVQALGLPDVPVVERLEWAYLHPHLPFAAIVNAKFLACFAEKGHSAV
jgi:hypothetical protein